MASNHIMDDTTYEKQRNDLKPYIRDLQDKIAVGNDITHVDGSFYKFNDDIKKDIYAYTAAFIDSDGYITMDKNHNPRVGLIATGNRGKAFMLEMKKSLGCGRLHLDQKSPQDTRPVNRLNFYSAADVNEILTKCLPHLKLKKANAEILLELLRMKKSHKKAKKKVEEKEDAVSDLDQLFPHAKVDLGEDAKSHTPKKKHAKKKIYEVEDDFEEDEDMEAQKEAEDMPEDNDDDELQAAPLILGAHTEDPSLSTRAVKHDKVDQLLSSVADEDHEEETPEEDDDEAVGVPKPKKAKKTKKTKKTQKTQKTQKTEETQKTQKTQKTKKTEKPKKTEKTKKKKKKKKMKMRKKKRKHESLAELAGLMV